MSKLLKMWYVWVLVVILTVPVFGVPYYFTTSTSSTICTIHGYLGILVWSDTWNYGAMLYRGTDSGWVDGIGDGVRVRHYDTTWWLRFEWKKDREAY